MNIELIQPLLFFVFLVSLGIWIGGATSLQVLITRSQMLHTHTQTIVLMRQILWIVTRLFVPLGMVGVAAAIGLIFLTEAHFTDPWIYQPLLLYLVIALIGTFYSFPEYQRLDQLAQEKGDNDVTVQRRLNRAAWVNRVELGLVYLVIFMIIQAIMS